MEKRKGRQTPTTSVVSRYEETRGQDAIDLYNQTSRQAREWQVNLIYDIMAVDDDGLWVHSKFGWEIPRRNGKGEILAIRELYGLTHGEKILHTAHRVTTSHSAWERLCLLLAEAGIEHKATKQLGLETIRLKDGGKISFRTRTAKGGLGEGFDLLIIDEAQEYTSDQESALKYVVTDSQNPQTLFCGTPPTVVSAGTVFPELRHKAITGKAPNTGWAEWSVDKQTDPYDKDAWYECNPSLGDGLAERNVLDEISGDEIDFNIQRLGLWLKYNQKSALSKAQWDALAVEKMPELTGKLFVGIKYAHDSEFVSVSVAARTTSGNIFVEVFGCRPVKVGDAWILDLLASTDYEKAIVDGASGQSILEKDAKDMKLKNLLIAKTKDVVESSALFEQAIESGTICHAGQKSLSHIVGNCEKRVIGNGGFGFNAIQPEDEISLLESVAFAYWLCAQAKEKKKQQSYY